MTDYKKPQESTKLCMFHTDKQSTKFTVKIGEQTIFSRLSINIADALL